MNELSMAKMISDMGVEASGFSGAFPEEQTVRQSATVWFLAEASY